MYQEKGKNTAQQNQVGEVNHKRDGVDLEDANAWTVRDDPTQPFVDQGITAQEIVIDDDVWLGAGAIVTNGV